MSHFRLIGYRGTGKDTFFRHLCDGTFATDGAGATAWEVYALDSRAACALGELLSPKTPKARVAYADALEADVHRRLGLPPPDEMGLVKDTFVLDGMTLREHYRARADDVKRLDRDHYVRATALALASAAEQSPRPTVVVTDQRYDNEHLADGWTVRLIRSAAGVPPVDDDSERGLDACVADILLVAPGDREHACRLFPQFRGYPLRARLRHAARDHGALGR